MKDKGKKVIFLCGGILIILTILSYILLDNTIINFPILMVSLFFVLLSELVTIVTLLRIKKEILNIGILTTAVLYFIGTLGLAIIFCNFIIFKVNIYILLNFILIGIILAIIMIIETYYNSINEKDNKILKSELKMKECRELIEVYLNDEDYKSYKLELEKIYDDIKYSDISTEIGMEEDLKNKIVDIKNNKENISERLKEISMIIKERSIKIRTYKSGGI